MGNCNIRAGMKRLDRLRALIESGIENAIANILIKCAKTNRRLYMYEIQNFIVGSVSKVAYFSCDSLHTNSRNIYTGSMHVA